MMRNYEEKICMSNQPSDKQLLEMSACSFTYKISSINVTLYYVCSSIFIWSTQITIYNLWWKTATNKCKICSHSTQWKSLKIKLLMSMTLLVNINIKYIISSISKDSMKNNYEKQLCWNAGWSDPCICIIFSMM